VRRRSRAVIRGNRPPGPPLSTRRSETLPARPWRICETACASSAELCAVASARGMQRFAAEMRTSRARDRRRATACAVVAALLVAGAAPSKAQACAACGCGDPTLTSMGAEQPFATRVRLSAELTHRTQAIGADLARLRIEEWRLDLGTAWFPTDWLGISASLPVLWRSAAWPAASAVASWGLGDAEIRTRAVMVRPNLGGHMFALVLGLRAPTAPTLRDQYGALRAESQPGTGSFAPMAGAQYGWYRDPWSVAASSIVFVPIGHGTGGIAPGPSLRTGVAVQWQPDVRLALRLGIDTRLDGIARERGRPDEDSGGFIAFLSPDVLLSPVDDLLVSVGLRIPVVNALRGHQSEGVYVTTALTVDL